MTCQQQKLTLHIQVYLTKLWKTSTVLLNSVKWVWKRWKIVVVYQQWQATGVWQSGWKITEDNSGWYCHSYLPYLRFKPTRKCVPSGLKESKSPSANQAPFTDSNSRPTSLLPTLSKRLENIWPDKMLFHSKLIDNRISACFREGHSTSTALTQMADDWLREINDKKIGRYEEGTQHPATTQLPVEWKRYGTVGASKDDKRLRIYRLLGIYSFTR